MKKYHKVINENLDKKILFNLTPKNNKLIFI